MKNVKRLEDVPIVNKLVKLEFLWDWLVLLLAIVIQVTLTPKLTATPCVDLFVLDLEGLSIRNRIRDRV